VLADHTMSDCIFCRIAAATLPADKVYEDELTLAFMDIFPVTDGHTLVVTREHYSNIFEATPQALQAVAATAKRVAHAIEQVLHPDGLMVFQLNGAAAGQTVFHYHMHLMPRADGEPLVLHVRQPGEPSRLKDLAASLRAAVI
jgi:histidine triad (HIT) family protein